MMSSQAMVTETPNSFKKMWFSSRVKAAGVFRTVKRHNLPFARQKVTCSVLCMSRYFFQPVVANMRSSGR